MISYVYEIATLMAIFMVASLGLAVIVSQAGLLSLAHGSSIGLGAYAFALLSTESSWPLLAALLLAMALPALVGALIAYFAAEFDEERFAVTTLAFNVLIINILINWTSLTHGSYGISQIPRITIFGFGESKPAFLAFCIFCTAAIYLLLQKLTNSGFGTLLRASGIQRDVVEALGASVTKLRVKAVALGSGVGGAAGALLAMDSGYIAPQMFELHLSILVLAMVILGTGYSMTGAAVGAALLVLVPEILRFTTTSASSAGPLRQVVFGILLLAVIFVQAWRNASTRPHGEK